MPAVSIGDIEDVTNVNDYGAYQEVRISKQANSGQILRKLVALGDVDHFERTKPSLHDIFVRMATDQGLELDDSLLKTNS